MVTSRAAAGRHDDTVAPDAAMLEENGAAAYPDNPVLVRVWRGDRVESQHRGAWVMTDAAGTVIESRGSWSSPIYARSSVKCLQALPLLESGAARRFAFTDAEVALALSSHNAEARHTDGVAALLDRLGLTVEHLQCGPQPPTDSDARARLRERGEAPSSLHNNCSGKHAGFLALALHLGVPVELYLDPAREVQSAVRRAVIEVTGVSPSDFSTAVDGCSAPTFRLPLQNLALAFARVSNPAGLAPERRAACERMVASVADHPGLIAGNQRLCTEISRVTRGKVFPKIGGEAVFAMGFPGRDRGMAIKIDDGSTRALHALVPSLLERLGLAQRSELEELHASRERSIRNWAGLEVGRIEVVP